MHGFDLKPASGAQSDAVDVGRTTSHRTNRWIFEVADFDEWANNQSETPSLRPEEAYLVARFFDKDTATLDAGTGGGRVALALRNAGYTDLHAFDFVPRSIEQARGRDPRGAIQFDVMDATDLRYAANTFGQLIYPSAMISSIEGTAQRQKAIQEAQRVLRPGGLAIMTALSFETAHRSKVHATFIVYLKMLRFMRRSNLPPNDLPWLRVKRRMNWSAFGGSRSAPALVHDHGIRAGASAIWIVDRGSRHPVADWAQPPLLVFDEFADEPITEMVYAVCRKYEVNVEH